jgi:hypothetical protein
LRCFDQKRRFGIDLLYPTPRYSVGLHSPTLCPKSVYLDGDCNCSAVIEHARALRQPEPPCTRSETGDPVQNPLFSNLSSELAFPRDPGQVFLAGIVGVPWQDIATADTLRDPLRLEYLRAADLARIDPALGYSRWDLIAGDVDMHIPPRDPFMVESIDPRSGLNPVTGDFTVGSSSVDPLANPINGHERVISERFDLQYACIFPLQTPRDCTNDDLCDCEDATESLSNPLCQPPSGGPGGTTQYFAKAYPCLRELDVLKRQGENSVTASICPKSSAGNKDDVGFGYQPAVAGIVKRLRCASLNAEFVTDPGSIDFGTVSCSLVGVRSIPVKDCSCDGVTRWPPADDAAIAVRSELYRRGQCGTGSLPPCEDFCLCEVPQTRGAALTACQTDASGQPIDPTTMLLVNGWCYIDPSQGFGNPALVQNCPPGSPRNVRLVGSAAPVQGETLFVACGTQCQAP